MSVTVNTPNGTATVAAGQDFVIDWPDAASETGPGLEILNGPQMDSASKAVAYYAPGQWYGVLINQGT